MSEQLSLAEKLSLLPVEERSQIIRELAPTVDELDVLMHSIRFWGRPSQQEPAQAYDTWLIRAGRGFGKTFTGGHWVITKAKYYPQCHIALIGQTKADVRDVMVEGGSSSILKLSSPKFMPIYEPSKRRVTWPNGSIATIYSGDEPDQLRGPQHHFAWMDELAKFKYPDDTLDQLNFGLRLGNHPQKLITTTPRPIPVIKQLVKDPTTIVTSGSTFENRSNLPEQFLRAILTKYQDTRLGQQELYGLILDDTPGALWNRQLLEVNRVKQTPELVRIVVGVDPAATSSEESNATGIIVAGLDSNGHGYVLEDLTIRGTPAQWGELVIKAYDKYKADRVVIETNQGGDMAVHVIQTAANALHASKQRSSKEIATTKVHASKGKYTRAEPISALYEQGKIHHIGLFAELEDEMCTWLPGETSPDRLDAMVWSFTELMLQQQTEVEIIENPFW